jgi:hypothetical protein
MGQQQSTNPKDRFGRMKPDPTAIPSAAIIHEALAMMNGSEKYGPYNWREKTVSARVYLAAANRHILAWLDGEEVASDSGIHHLGHARASLGILLDAQATGNLVDDRPVPGPAPLLLEQFTRRSGTFVINATDQAKVDAASDGALVPVTGLIQGKGPDLHPKQEWSPQDCHIIGLGAGGQDGSLARCPPRVYIAGPMRGLPLFNFPAFDTARDLAIAKGFNPTSPADMDRDSGFHEDNSPEAAHGAEAARDFAKRDCDALIGFRAEDGDAIALLPGWEKSTGAVAEFFLARWLGLRILDARTMEPFKQGAIRVTQLQAIVKSIWQTIFGSELR